MHPAALRHPWARTLAPLVLLSVLTPLALDASGDAAGGASGGALPPADDGVTESPPVPDGQTKDRDVPTGGSLEGVDWVFVAYRSGDRLVQLDDPKGPARLRFEDGRVSGSAGCNHLSGAYTRAGDRLRFDPSMASTMMACPEPIMDQEQAIHAALGAVVSHRLAPDRLELLDAAGEVLLHLVPLAPPALTGTLWHLSSYNNGKQALVSARAGTEITLELHDDGRLGGSDGCNRYMSGFTLEDERLTIGPIATTRMACRGPEVVREQAAAYAAALGTVAAFRIAGDELILVNGEGAPAARFRADR